MLRKENMMSKQLALFETAEFGWTQRLWRGVGDQKRKQVIVLLAELAKVVLQNRRVQGEGEKPHE
jgi:hypothetical protein